jgi:hypothetical protein
MPNVLDAVALAATSSRLSERAEQITQITLQGLAEDLRIAARCCDALALIRAEVSEIMSKCQDADAARELRDLLDDAEAPLFHARSDGQKRSTGGP